MPPRARTCSSSVSGATEVSLGGSSAQYANTVSRGRVVRWSSYTPLAGRFDGTKGSAGPVMTRDCGFERPSWFVHGMKLSAFFGEVGPKGGGTTVLPGAHRVVDGYLNIVVGRNDAGKSDVLRRPAHPRSPLLVTLTVALACIPLGRLRRALSPLPRKRQLYLVRLFYQCPRQRRPHWPFGQGGRRP